MNLFLVFWVGEIVFLVKLPEGHLPLMEVMMLMRVMVI